jgi:hypothetical protein
VTTTTQRILCGPCKSDLTGPADHDDDSIFKCPVCGQSDRFGNIVNEAADYWANKLADDMMGDFEQKVSSKSMKVTTTKSPQRTYRFIMVED